MRSVRLLAKIPTVLLPSKEAYGSLTATSLASSLQDYIISDHPFHGQKIHSRILKTGFIPNVNISIKLLILYLKSSCLSYARQVFDGLPKRTLSAYNYMISGYVRHGCVDKAFDLARELCLLNKKPDAFTYSMILKGSNGGNEEPWLQCMGREVHCQIVKCDIDGDDVLYTALVDWYVKRGSIEYARRLCDLMLENDVICSTSMITGYMNKGRFEDAEDVFEKTIEKDTVVYNAMIEGYSKTIETAKMAIEMYVDMRRLDFMPTISTYASIIGACSILSAFEIGQQVQGQLMKTEFFMDIKVGSALIDMYCKCGRTDDARCIFDHMPKTNVFSWTSMIDGYGKNGNPSEALELFDNMTTECHIVPNHVTFLGALSACAHAGFVSKGREIFDSIERIYSMKPTMEHYACLIDLLGRTGNLNQALEFVMQMPEKPNSDVWAALLSSCRLHGDVDLAKIAANELFKLSSNKRPGAYVALSNTLAEAGSWDGVSHLRELMKVQKQELLGHGDDRGNIPDMINPTRNMPQSKVSMEVQKQQQKLRKLKSYEMKVESYPGTEITVATGNYHPGGDGWSDSSVNIFNPSNDLQNPMIKSVMNLPESKVSMEENRFSYRLFALIQSVNHM